MKDDQDNWESLLIYDVTRTYVSRDSVYTAFATLTARCEALEQAMRDTAAKWREVGVAKNTPGASLVSQIEGDCLLHCANALEELVAP